MLFNFFYACFLFIYVMLFTSTNVASDIISDVCLLIEQKCIRYVQVALNTPTYCNAHHLIADNFCACVLHYDQCISISV